MRGCDEASLRQIAEQASIARPLAQHTGENSYAALFLGWKCVKCRAVVFFSCLLRFVGFLCLLPQAGAYLRACSSLHSSCVLLAHVAIAISSEYLLDHFLSCAMNSALFHQSSMATKNHAPCRQCHNDLSFLLAHFTRSYGSRRAALSPALSATPFVCRHLSPSREPRILSDLDSLVWELPTVPHHGIPIADPWHIRRDKFGST